MRVAIQGLGAAGTWAEFHKAGASRWSPMDAGVARAQELFGAEAVLASMRSWPPMSMLAILARWRRAERRTVPRSALLIAMPSNNQLATVADGDIARWPRRALPAWTTPVNAGGTASAAREYRKRR